MFQSWSALLKPHFQLSVLTASHALSLLTWSLCVFHYINLWPQVPSPVCPVHTYFPPVSSWAGPLSFWGVGLWGASWLPSQVFCCPHARDALNSQSEHVTNGLQMLPHLWVIVRPLCLLLPFFRKTLLNSLEWVIFATHSLSRASSQWPSLISQLWPLISSFSVLSLSPWKFSPPNHSSTWSSWVLPIFFNQNVSAMKNCIDFVYRFLE